MVSNTEAKRPALTQSDAPTPGRLNYSGIDQTVRRRIAACPYGFVFERITWHVADGTLTLHGSVPSFYLKQVLQELLRNMEQIDRLENEVHVVSATGLSSDRRRVHWRA